MKRLVGILICLALFVPSGSSYADLTKTQPIALFEIPPLSSALHVLPPIGENSGDKNNLDETIIDYLTVSVWQVMGEDDYLQLAEFTSQKQNRGLDYIKLQGDKYHVNWDIAKEDIGKEFLIHFTVANLSIGYVTYMPKVGKTLPIKFRIDNHPAIRARILNEQGFTAFEVTSALIDEFQLGAGEIAQVLADERYDVFVIGEILRDIFGASPQEAAQLLSNTDSYSAQDIAQVLMDVFGLSGDALTVSQILKEVGFSASQIMDVLKDKFGLDTAEIVNILSALGFTSEELFAATSRGLAEQFAPQLRFDQSAWTFPMSAQEYFEGTIDVDIPISERPRLENTDPSTLTTPGMEPPTYFKAFQVGNQIRILYWWYYGYQPGCWAPFVGAKGIHDGDWERVMVMLSEDLSHVAAVTYWQHGGWYTRLAQGGDSDRFLGASYDPGLSFYGEHPIVYVGKTQHGSYHNQGGSGDPISGGGLSYCPYFDDWRNNEGNSDLWLDTQNNLKSLADFEEPWMIEETTESNVPLGTGDGSTTDFDLDSKYIIESSIQIKMNGTVLNEDTWSFSNGTGTDGRDQVVFNDAPEDGEEITADLEKGDFQWGCGPCEDNGIGNHPIKTSNPDSISTLNTCKGFDATIFGETRGCFESQCEYHDNQTGWTDFHPGTCTHCPSGYTDMGTYCWKTGWPWEWRFTDLHWYGLKFTISQSDHGLSKTR